MDWERGVGLRAWLIDVAAAGVAGAAVALCLARIGMPFVALPGGAGVLLLTFCALQSISPGPGRYRVPSFSIQHWDDVLDDDVLQLTEAEQAAPDEALEGQGSGVVRLFPMTPLPTAGELKQRIDAHLAPSQPSDDDNVVLLSADASAALRSALAELRRAIR